MPKPLIAEGSYPDLDGLSHDPCAVRALSPAYASSSGELNATLQYIYHSINFACSGDRENAERLKSIAVAEMMHLEMLAEALIRLGAQPVYTFNPPSQFNFYSTKFVAYSRSLRNMIEDDIMGEKYAVYIYERMLTRLKNPVLQTLVCRIIDDENLHIEVLKEILGGLKCR